MRPLRAIHVVAGLDQHYGGPSYSVPRIAQAQSVIGVDVRVASVAGPGEAAANIHSGGYIDIRSRWDAAAIPLLRNLRYSKSLSCELAELAPKVDVVHNHGLWLMPNVQAALEAKKAGKPLVLSPRGMLAPAALAFSHRRKKLFWKFVQGPALSRLACIHATSLQEAEEVRAFGLMAPIAVIPNGVDLPKLVEPRPAAPDGYREVLYLGRLHPKKSLHTLIRAWGRLEFRCAKAGGFALSDRMRTGTEQQLNALIGELALNDVVLDGPIYGNAKIDAYRRAEFFVLPTLNENFGISVAEALAAETPAISTRGAPWQGLVSEKCGFWPEHGVEPLAVALQHAMSLPDGERRQMGARGRAWVARDFSWRTVAISHISVYDWLCRGGDRPPTVLAH